MFKIGRGVSWFDYKWNCEGYFQKKPECKNITLTLRSHSVPLVPPGIEPVPI